MSPVEEDRLNALSLLTQWLRNLPESAGVRESHFFGSVLRPRDFTAGSDVDLLLIIADAAPGDAFEPELRKLSPFLGHTVDLTVFREGQLRAFSPLHQLSNIVFSLGTNHPGLIGTLPETRAWFDPSFIRFWYWHDCLRSLFTWLKDNPGKLPPESFFRRKASYTKVVELRGHVTYSADDSLDAHADLWPGGEWKTPVTFADWALEHLTRASGEIRHPEAKVNAPIRSEIRFSFSRDEAFFREMKLKEFCDLLKEHGTRLHGLIRLRLSELGADKPDSL